MDQVSNTVAGYVDDMGGVMALVEATLQTAPQGSVIREEFFENLLKIRSDVAAVTTYSADGELLNCWALDHTPREEIHENLSFNREMLTAYAGGYISQPHVESIFEGWYPWVVTMLAPLETSGEEVWVAVDLRFGSISSYINNVGIGQHGYCFLMDQSGGFSITPSSS